MNKSAVSFLFCFLLTGVVTEAAPVTFNKDIASIIYENCSSCHRPGEIAPFSLLSYQDAAKRAKLIATVTARRYMPPWKPEPGFGDFADVHRLTDQQLQLIQEWAGNGAPEGDAKDKIEPPKFTDGWRLGIPDLIVEMPQEFSVPADGRDIYRCFVVPLNLTEDKSVVGIEFRPGNRKVVHHSILHLEQPGRDRRRDGADGHPGYNCFGGGGVGVEGGLGGWVPGQRPDFLPDDVGRSVPKGSDLIIQNHYHSSGKPETDRSSVGIYFSKKPTNRTVVSIPIAARNIYIPAGDAAYKVSASFTTPIQMEVTDVAPHMHLLGKQMKVTATLPDGTTRPMIWIKNWDFNWQSDYHYEKPMTLPKGTRLEMRFTYDNSTNNIQNPNTPPRRVRYGPQSSDAMGELWFQLLPLKPDGMQLLNDARAAKSRADGIDYYEFLLLHDPNNVEAHTKLGFIRFLQGSSDEGIAHLRKAIALDPQADMPHYKLGLVFRSQNRFAEAKAEFEAALKLNPRNNDAHANMGIIYAAEGNLQLAEEHLRAALKINPDDPNARELLSELLKAKANR